MAQSRAIDIQLPGGVRLALARPVIAGILNVTPDSFSDGGAFLDPQAAARHAREMVRDGAGLIDIGAETTQPGAAPVPADEQWRRLSAVLHELIPSGGSPARLPRQFPGELPGELPGQLPGVAISIDTQSAAVAEQALAAGAGIINDISAGRDPRMFEVVARAGAGLILMHMQGDPATMQRQPMYRDVVGEVREFLLGRAAAAIAAGIAAQRIIIDPGLGFGKTVEHNLMLLTNLDAFIATGYPVMLGASRKRFLSALSAPGGRGAESGAANDSGQGPGTRLGGTCAVTAIGVAAGVALFRVHDVGANRQAADLAWMLMQQRRWGGS